MRRRPGIIVMAGSLLVGVILSVASDGLRHAAADTTIICSGKSKPVHQKLRYQFACHYGGFTPTDISIVAMAKPKRYPHRTMRILSASDIRALHRRRAGRPFLESGHGHRAHRRPP